MYDHERFAEAVQERRWEGPPAYWREKPSAFGSVINAARFVASAVRGRAVPEPVIRTVTLDPSIASGTAEHARVERSLEAAGMRIVQKNANAFQDSLTVEISPEAIEAVTTHVSRVDGVHAVAPPGVPKPVSLPAGSAGGDSLVFLYNEACTAAGAARGATRLDSLPFDAKTLANLGSGVLVIVWDFAPEIDEARLDGELSVRPGGKTTLYNLTASTQRMSHGSSVASTCCGASAGVAKSATLVLVSLGNNPSSDLSVIAALLRAHRGPAVVNMSFSIEFEVNTAASDGGAADRTAIRRQMAALDAFVVQLQKENTRVAFVVAAGNESRDVCSVADVTSDGKTVMQWPQQRFGATSSPYVFVGATVTGVSGGRVTQALAGYSNRGSCVNALAPGGWWCVYHALPSAASPPPFQLTQGTSFASPAVAGLLALVLAARPTASAAEAAQALLAGSRRAQNVPPGTTNVLATLPEDAFGPAPAQAASKQAASTQAASTQAAQMTNGNLPTPDELASMQAVSTRAAQGTTGKLPTPDELAPRETLAPPPGAAAEKGVSYALAALMLFAFLCLIFVLLRK